MLLERPGEVVTREDLRGRLWPTEVFVDFESSRRPGRKPGCSSCRSSTRAAIPRRSTSATR
jgi:hypothetical protein